MAKETHSSKTSGRHSGRTDHVDSAAEAMAVKDLDDPLVHFFKTAGQWFETNWRIAVVVGGLVLLIVAVVAWNITSTSDSERRAWDRLYGADSVSSLQDLLVTETGQPTMPYIHLRIIELLETGQDDTMEPAEHANALRVQIEEFIAAYGTEDRFAATVERLQARLAVVKADHDLLKTGSGNRISLKGGETTVIAPEFDPATGAWKPLANPVVVFETRYGPIRCELLEDQAPNTVANLVHLVQSGFYNLNGPGGIIKRAGESRDPGLIRIGEFPAMTPSRNPQGGSGLQSYDELKDTDERVGRFAKKYADTEGTGEKWITVFNARNLGYTIRFERSGATPVLAGSLVMRLKTTGAEEPNSASSEFFITSQRIEDWDGRYVVFGRLADDASAEVTRRVADDTDIRVAWMETVRPDMRDRVIARRAGDGVEELNRPDYVAVTARGYLHAAADASTAQYIALTPGFVEVVPAGSHYRQPTGLIEGTRYPSYGEIAKAEDNANGVVEYFGSDAAVLDRASRLVPPMGMVGAWTLRSGLAGLGRRTAVRLLTPRVPVLDENGNPVAREYRPLVKYADYPNLVEAKDAWLKVNAPANPLDLFGPIPGVGAQPRPGMPGGMPPGLGPGGIDPRTGRPIPGGGGLRIPGMPGAPGGGSPGNPFDR